MNASAVVAVFADNSGTLVLQTRTRRVEYRDVVDARSIATRILPDRQAIGVPSDTWVFRVRPEVILSVETDNNMLLVNFDLADAEPFRCCCENPGEAAHDAYILVQSVNAIA